MRSTVYYLLFTICFATVGQLQLNGRPQGFAPTFDCEIGNELNGRPQGSLLQKEGKRLNESIDSLIRVTSFLRTSELGMAVYDLDEGRILYRHNSQKLFRPASTQKIITAVTALYLLGKDYEYRTSLFLYGEISGDTLHGDICVTGGLDPLFTDEDMNTFVEAIYNKGIRYVDGGLIGDVSLMDSIYWGSGWSWDDAPGYYQPYVSPLMLNGGYVDIAVIPSSKGARPKVSVTPVSDYYTVDNKALSMTPSLGNIEVSRNWMYGGNEIVVTGNSSSQYNCKLSIFPSEQFFLSTLLYELRLRGIIFRSEKLKVKIEKLIAGDYEETGDRKGRPYIEIEEFQVSTELADVMEKALKKSDNLCAETMFILMGMTLENAKSTSFEDGGEAVKKFMKEVVGRSPDDCNIVDGSGLSPYNLISPDLMMEYLKLGSRHELFILSLPVSGTDGTLRNRMKRGKAFGNVRAKTGSVTGVSTLAGFAEQKSTGHRLAFVIFNQNILKSREARNFQDKVCELLCR